MMADDRVAAENRGVGVDDYLILEGRMTFHAANNVAGGVPREGESAKRDALVKLHVGANVAGLADDDAGAVVDEETATDASAGMNINACFRVGPLRHHARDERHAQKLATRERSGKC